MTLAGAHTQRLVLAVGVQSLLGILVEEVAGHDLVEEAQVSGAVFHGGLDQGTDFLIGVGVLLVVLRSFFLLFDLKHDMFLLKNIIFWFNPADYAWRKS